MFKFSEDSQNFLTQAFDRFNDQNFGRYSGYYNIRHSSGKSIPEVVEERMRQNNESEIEAKASVFAECVQNKLYFRYNYNTTNLPGFYDNFQREFYSQSHQNGPDMYQFLKNYYKNSLHKQNNFRRTPYSSNINNFHQQNSRSESNSHNNLSNSNDQSFTANTKYITKTNLRNIKKFAKALYEKGEITDDKYNSIKDAFKLENIANSITSNGSPDNQLANDINVLCKIFSKITPSDELSSKHKQAIDLIANKITTNLEDNDSNEKATSCNNN